MAGVLDQVIAVCEGHVAVAASERVHLVNFAVAAELRRGLDRGVANNTVTREHTLAYRGSIPFVSSTHGKLAIHPCGVFQKETIWNQTSFVH